MSSQGNVPVFARVRQLFGYETGGNNSPIWANPQNFSSERDRGAFNIWKNRKRSFMHEQIRDSHWLSIREQGNTLLLHCLPDESVSGTNLFHREVQISGKWELIDSGIENLHILRIDLKNNYPLFVLANRESPIHSAIGFLREGTQTYFKFIELR